MKNLKLIGFTVSITFIMFIALAFFIKSIGILFGPFFEDYAMIIAILSGIVLLLGAITGTISIRAMTNNRG